MKPERLAMAATGCVPDATELRGLRALQSEGFDPDASNPIDERDLERAALAAVAQTIIAKGWTVERWAFEARAAGAVIKADVIERLRAALKGA